MFSGGHTEPGLKTMCRGHLAPIVPFCQPRSEIDRRQSEARSTQISRRPAVSNSHRSAHVRVGPSKSAKRRGDTKPRGPPNVFGRPASLGPGQSMRSPVWPYRPTKGAMRASCSAIASSRVNVGSGAGTAGVEVGWLLAVAGARTSPRGSSRSPPKLTAPAANEATMATTKPAPMSGTRARCWRSGV